MTDIKQTARRYLLGELSEAEQQAMEEAYFGDPHVLDEIAREEHALIDEYVRGRLAPDVHGRFESAYLSQSERRARVEVAQALLTRVDAAPVPDVSSSPRATWLTAWLGHQPWLAAAAVAAAIVVGIAAWMTLQVTRRGPDSQQTQSSNGSPPGPPDPVSGPMATPTLAVVTLSLTVGAGQRSSMVATPTSLEIPGGTEAVRFALSLRERDYRRYRVVLRAIDGAEILRRGDLRPSLEPSGPALTIDLPASAFESGDYMLTLQGTTGNGEFDDVSQSLIRVVKRSPPAR